MNALRSHARRAAFATAGAALVALVALETSLPEQPATEVLGANQSPGTTVDAACDIDGVAISYAASYSAVAPAGYKVASADVEGVSPTCAGGTVTVRLTSGLATVATATAPVAAATVTVPFAAPPPARDVDGVAIEIAGGTVPVPAACQGMAFDNYKTLGFGNDSYTATRNRDLVHALEGNDTVLGGNQRDCLTGGPGADQLDGENQDDVLVGDAGNDTLRGGSGDDVLDGGEGIDTCVGGPGRTTFISCEVQQR